MADVKTVGAAGGAGKPGFVETESSAEQRRHLDALLKQAKEWATQSEGKVGGSFINTEGLRLLLALNIQILETLIDGKPTTKIPSRHHE